jgi:signal transduction histidine kinase
VELALFRILQESLTNVHRHSGSLTVDIQIAVDAEMVSLNVRDAGRGIPHRVMEEFRRSGNAGVGLAGMRARLVDLGGELRVQSDEKGTLLQATIPLHEETRKPPQHESAA